MYCRSEIVLRCISESRSMLCSWKERYLLKAFTGVWWSCTFLREARMSLWCFACLWKLWFSFKSPRYSLCYALWKGTEVFQAEGCTLSLSGYQAEGFICELLPVIAHSQGDAKVRGSSLMQRWSSWGNLRNTEGKRRLQGRSRFSEAREPSQWMSYILLEIGQEDFALPPESLGKDSWLAPSRALCRGVGSCFILFV